MTAWEDVVQSALLGTERRPCTVPEADGALGLLLLKISGTGEQALLSAAAVLAQYRRAGNGAERFSANVPSPCLEEELPYCSQNAARLLTSILQLNKPWLLREWLVLAGRTRRICPPVILPQLLTTAAQDKSMRPLLLPVVGARGLWLAAQNSAWSCLGGEILSEKDWVTGNKAARASFLTHCRNSNPARASELLQLCWTEETATDRAFFLSFLENGLSLEDEPFLESCLNDRSKEVRKTAALLLAQLPKSQLAQRILERGIPCINIERKLLGSRMVLSLPQAYDEEMKQLGMEETRPKAQGFLGSQAWWLLQTVALVPPSTWCDHLSCSPGELIKLAKKTDYFEALLGGWSEAARLHRDSKWAQALLEHEPLDMSDLKLSLARLLTPEAAESFVFGYINAGEGLERLQYANVRSLQYLDRPWSWANSRTALKIIFEALSRPVHADAYRGAEIRTAAQFMDTSVYAEAVAQHMRTASVDSPLAGAITEFMDLFKLRHDMNKEFAP